MLLPQQLLLCIDITTILLGPTWERKTKGMRLAVWLAGWLAGDDDEAATVIRQSVPAECGTAAAQEATYKGGDKERKYSSTNSATADVGSTIQRCVRGRKNVYFGVREEKGGFDAPMRNPPDCPPPPAANTSRPPDLLVFFFFFLSFFPFPTEVPNSRVPSLPSLPCFLPPPPPTSSERASRGLAARGHNRCRLHRGQRCGCPKNNKTL